MTLRALPGGKRDPAPTPPGGKPTSRGAEPTDKARRFAPGAPTSPGTVPLELADPLRANEPVIWWNEKDRVSWRAVLYTLGLGLLGLAAVTLFAPEFWDQPWGDVWKPAAVPVLPALLVFARERASMRAILITDTSIIELGWRGATERLAFRNIRRVRRDLITGGILLEGKSHRIRIPPCLLDDAQTAIASQTARTLGSGDEGPDDPLGWLPR